MKILSLIIFFLIVPAEASIPSKSFQFKASLDAILRNASMPDVSNGLIVTSPSRSYPNYYFDRVRDTALAMGALIDYWDKSKDDFLKLKILSWVEAETKRQNVTAPNGLGESKFNIDGTPFTGSSGRPQNDGPALRALSMIKFARLLLNRGERDYVQRRLYNNVLPDLSPIKKDLDYTAFHWREYTLGPWEEEMGLHFYTLLVQHTALQEGASLALELGDGGAHDFYSIQSRLIGAFIKQNFFDDQIGIKTASFIYRGLSYKKSGLDVSPLLALIHTWPHQKLIQLQHPNVKKYIRSLTGIFKELFSINTVYSDLGIAIGRYPEDKYDGQDSNSSGNPWILSTLALGEYYCLAHGPRYEALAEKQFQRVLFHSDAAGALDEQIDRETGFMQGAIELTWSHSAFITAMMRCGAHQR